MAKGKLVFTQQISKTLEIFCQKHQYNHIIFIADNHTAKHCLPFLNQVNNKIIIKAGENYKNIETYGFIIQKLIDFKANKNTLIVNVGGGVVTDIGAFAAATFQRGIAFVNIPTTLVGMVDAAIGGKTGIDFNFYKNYIGTFSLAERVMISTQFLATLPQKQIESGWAEIIKTGIIVDKKLLKLIEQESPLEDIVKCCANTKQAIIEKDIKDKGMRQLLNFGHTIGHAYESYKLSTAHSILHGYAVAKGILAESKIAYSLGKINHSEYLVIEKLIKKYTFQTEISVNEFNLMKKWLKSDKKNIGVEIIFSLPERIGKGSFGNSIPKKSIEKLIFS